MPTRPTYPGVYIEEVPSEVRTITGVATSIAAFVGRAKRGPLNEPTIVNCYADFERIFGGLWADSTMSYAVRDFFNNGGSQAIVVRLFNDPQDPNFATISLAPEHIEEPEIPDGDPLTLRAANPGSWGNLLRARVDHDITDDEEFLEKYDLTSEQMFNLTIYDGDTESIESFRNLTHIPNETRSIDKILESGSKLVRVHGNLPQNRPVEHADPDQDNPLWKDNVTSSGVTNPATDRDGTYVAASEYISHRVEKRGIYALEKADLFNILCIPPNEDNGNLTSSIWDTAAAFCEQKRAILLVDPQMDWDKGIVMSQLGTLPSNKNAAFYFPCLRQPNPLHENQLEKFVPCGAIAGIFARTDTQRGVWKAPAGLETTLVGVPELSVPLNDADIGDLNPLGVNCLRSMPAAGRVVWGARTLRGDDRLADPWKYLPVRRTALFIEESLYRGTQWVVFEPNDEPLWSQIRLNVGAFMYSLFRQGAFQGKKNEAYFVKCDKETTTQDDINRGIVNILVGFAPLKPAEFVIIKISQMAGRILK